MFIQAGPASTRPKRGRPPCFYDADGAKKDCAFAKIILARGLPPMAGRAVSKVAGHNPTRKPARASPHRSGTNSTARPVRPERWAASMMRAVRRASAKVAGNSARPRSALIK
jgi:hypothetical protein